MLMHYIRLFASHVMLQYCVVRGCRVCDNMHVFDWLCVHVHAGRVCCACVCVYVGRVGVCEREKKRRGVDIGMCGKLW